jgi:hypothetical protein
MISRDHHKSPQPSAIHQIIKENNSFPIHGAIEAAGQNLRFLFAICLVSK